MSPSIAGLIVFGVLCFVGHLLGSPLLIGLMASMALSSTAFATLSSLGGSSPQIYTLFAFILILCLMLRPGGLREILTECGRHRASLLCVMAIVYSVGTALIMPRLFAGNVSAFVPNDGAVREVALGPTAGNITQPAYFALGAIMCLVLCIRMREPGQIDAMRRGFFAWVVLNAALGLLDMLGKSAGAGDILLPIRTANYALLTDVEQAGFSRIAGGHPEASAFAAAMFAGLVFAATYWRARQRWGPFLVLVSALLLVVMSTSTTAYACLGVYGAWLGFSAVVAFLRGHVRRSDMILAGVVLVGFTLCLGIYLADDSAFANFQRLFEVTIIKKSQSESALERGYWNAKSLQTVFETYGLGIGMGSSRASNWLVAALSQVGVIGVALQLTLAAMMLRPLPRGAWSMPGVAALHEGARASAFAVLVANFISGGSADPGMVFFIGLATTVSCRDAILRRPGMHGAEPKPEKATRRTRSRPADIRPGYTPEPQSTRLGGYAPPLAAIEGAARL